MAIRVLLVMSSTRPRITESSSLSVLEVDCVGIELSQSSSHPDGSMLKVINDDDFVVRSRKDHCY